MPLLAVLMVVIITAISIIRTEVSVHCSPPPDPVKCSSWEKNDCTVTNCYGCFPDRSVCQAADVAYPTTEEELISVVATAAMNGRKMKVGTPTSHSIPKLVCPDGQQGLLISTKFLNRVLSVDKKGMTLTAEPGVTLRSLIEEAAKAGLALPYTPYWWGVTVGGMLGTGAHGSSLWGGGSAVHDHVVALRIVSPAGPEEGYAKVRTLRSSNITAPAARGVKDHQRGFNAARASLGVLGVISQVTLQLQPLFKRSITYKMKDDVDLGHQVANFGHQHEFADLAWYPSQRKVVYRIDDRVPSNTDGNGLYNFLPFRSTPSLLLASIRIAEETQELLGDANGKCEDAIAATSTLYRSTYGLTNDGIVFEGYPVIGYQNRVQSSGGCLDSPEDGRLTACPWDPRVQGLFFYQTGISIAMSKVKAFIQDVQKLVELEPKSLCVLELYNGILMRYVTASSAYLGKQEDGVDFDITYYRSRDPSVPRLFEDVLEEVEQLAVFKYGGLPHWGKNRNVAFVGAIDKYRDAAKFLTVKREYDPSGLFSSEWTDRVLLEGGRGVTVVREGCALEGLCICSEDIHCAPNLGYFCRPGRIYKEARVCSSTLA